MHYQPDPSSTPFQYLCPITHNLMLDPVITVDGHTFQRSAIQQWFKSHNTNPLTNKQLPSLNLITNRNLKSLVSAFIQKVSGNSSVQIGYQDKIKKFMQSVNQGLIQKYPKLFDDFGMIKVKSLDHMAKQNKTLKQQNQMLKQTLQKLHKDIQNKKNILQHNFPQLCNDGQIDIKLLLKLIKKQKSSSLDNQLRIKQISILKQQLQQQHTQKTMAMDLMNATSSQGQSLTIVEPWYDSAAVAIGHIMVPPTTLFIHITEVNFILNNNYRKYIINYCIFSTYKPVDIVESMKYVSIQLQSYNMCIFLECMTIVRLFQSKYVSYYRMYNIVKLYRGNHALTVQKIFARALDSKSLHLLTNLTLKIHHDLFDGVQLTPMIDALNSLPKLKKLTIIVDPQYTVHQKNWTQYISKAVLTQVIIK